MKIVMLDGGLANQMTQYIFARCLQEETEDQVLLDDLYFHVPNLSELVESSGHFQLNKFPNITKVPLISEYFDQDVWEEIVNRAAEMGPLLGGSRLPQILKDNGLDFFMIAEHPAYEFDGMVARMPYYYHIPEMLKAQGNAYYYGYFTNGGWFMSHEEMFRSELTLPKPESNTDMEMLHQIENSYSVGIHIRCGGGFKVAGIAFPPEYYKNKINELCKFVKSSKHKDLKRLRFFIFSDDIAWCKDNSELLGLANLPYPVSFSQEHRGPSDNHIDLKLLSMCDIIILNNSVYGYMAALLNHKSDKIILNPIKQRGVF